MRVSLGKEAIARLFTGLSRPKKIPGDVFAGVIETVGKNVTEFKPGERVYGSSGEAFGTNFEQMAEAHSYVETGHKRGSAVVIIDQTSTL